MFVTSDDIVYVLNSQATTMGVDMALCKVLEKQCDDAQILACCFSLVPDCTDNTREKPFLKFLSCFSNNQTITYARRFEIYFWCSLSYPYQVRIKFNLISIIMTFTHPSPVQLILLPHKFGIHRHKYVALYLCEKLLQPVALLKVRGFMEWSFRTVNERRIKVQRYKVMPDHQSEWRCKHSNGKFDNGFDEAGDHGGKLGCFMFKGTRSIRGLFAGRSLPSRFTDTTWGRNESDIKNG
ncbi:hypothetical protein PILCRDRAFT_89948 [Piloderma croceum F 1598]|uniref:Uncharacterized protein n=1 Tax=Piloderma croceum (strain F 1598) TaxID=765440 RepID=A0A0C3B0W9_PILCF|nr:hypothetical protein PILCRDRAFT_89948 [Piloderma croceum F 1598]